MKKRLIKFRNGHHANDLKCANADLAAYNKLLDEIKAPAVLLKLELSSNVVSHLLAAPKEYAFDAIIGDKPLTVAGVPVSRKKAMDLIEWDLNWLDIIKAVDLFNQHLVEHPHHKTSPRDVGGVNRIGIEQFIFSGGQFQLSPAFLEFLKEKHSLYTKTEKQNQVHDELMKIIAGFEKLKELGVWLKPDLDDDGELRNNQVSFDVERIMNSVKG